MRLAVLLFVALAVPSVARGQDPSVERELRLRALFAERGPAAVTKQAAIGAIRSVEGPEWLVEFCALDAVHRAGGLTAGEPASTRGELKAPALRCLLEPDLGRLAERLLGALDSSFSAEREAALDRIARALLEEPGFREVLCQQVVALERAPVGAPDLVALIERAGFHGGGAAAHGRLVAGPAGDALRAQAGQLLTMPLDAGVVEAATDADPGLGAALQLMGSVRSTPGFDGVAGLRPGELEERHLEWLELCAEEIQLRRALGNLRGTERLERVAHELLALPAETGAWQSGLRMLPAAEALAIMEQLGAPLQVESLEVIDETAGGMPVEGLLRAARAQDTDLAMTALYLAGRRFAYGGEEHLLPVVLEALGTDDEILLSRAFDWISTRSRTCDGELHRAWAERGGPGGGTPLQYELLRRLTRERPSLPFRGDLLRLLEEDATPDASVIELLGLMAEDQGVRRRLEALLENEVEAIVQARSYPERLPHDGLAAQLAAALGHTLGGAEGDAALDRFERSLRRTMDLLHGSSAREDRRAKFPKRAVAEIARRDVARMGEWLGAEVPRRIRVEAALQALGKGADAPLARAAAQRIIQDYDGVDGTLRLRGLRALGQLPSDVRIPGLDEFLARLVGQRATPEARAAVELAVQRGAWELLDPPLAAVIDGPAADETEFELAREVALRRGEFGGEVMGTALGLLTRCDARLRHAPDAASSDALLALRGALLQSISRGVVRDVAAGRGNDAVVERALFAVLLRPKEAARDDLRARLAGETRLKVAFRWAAELAAFEALAAVGLGERVLAATPGWSSMDPRLLAALGARCGDDPVAVRLLETALFGLGGERESRTWARARAQAWLSLAAALPAEGRSRAAQGLCRDLWTGRVRPQVVGALESDAGPAGPVVARVVAAALEGRAGFERERARWLRVLPGER